MGNLQSHSPPSYDEKVGMFPSSYTLTLHHGCTEIAGNINTSYEMFNRLPRPEYAVISDKGCNVYCLPMNLGYVRKDFKKLLSLKITPGKYNVKIILTHRCTSKITEFNLKMNSASYDKLCNIVNDIYRNKSVFHATYEYDYINLECTIAT